MLNQLLKSPKRIKSPESSEWWRWIDFPVLLMGWLCVLVLWGAVLFPYYWAWPHPIGSSGGAYFFQRVIVPVPSFAQGDDRWRNDPLGSAGDTLGAQGCAVTCAAMVLSAYGLATDPQQLNRFLNTHGGYTPQGWLTWEKACELAPAGYVRKAYEDLPSYALLDANLRAGNPVIVRLRLPNGHTHFVVIVGKQGWDYLIRDPARAEAGIYPLKQRATGIQALRFYTVLQPLDRLVATNSTSLTH